MNSRIVPNCFRNWIKLWWSVYAVSIYSYTWTRMFGFPVYKMGRIKPEPMH
jgi:hypothetical protein